MGQYQRSSCSWERWEIFTEYWSHKLTGKRHMRPRNRRITLEPVLQNRVLTCERNWAGLSEARMACFCEDAVMNWWIFESSQIWRRADWYKCTGNSEELKLPRIWRQQDLLSYRYLSIDLQGTISQRLVSTSAKLRAMLTIPCYCIKSKCQIFKEKSRH